MADKNLTERVCGIVKRSGDQFNSLDFETRKSINQYKEAMKILTLYQVIESYQEFTTSAWRRKMRDWLKACVDDYEREEKSNG